MVKYKKHKSFKPRKRTLKIPQGISQEEIDLRNSIAYAFPGMIIYESNRQILNGKEIDIWIPSHNLGIEYDGLRFHSDDKSPKYHLDKTLRCEKKGVRLIHIFSDEWLNKKKIVLDVIYKALGKYKSLIPQQVAEISKIEGDKFLNNFHLTGTDPTATKYIGAFYSSQLIAVLAYTEDDNSINIVRYAELPGIKISKGVSYLLPNTSKSISAYVDRRFSQGLEFKEAGFTAVRATHPNIYYTKDYKNKVLSDFVKLNENQIKKANLHTVYDCGYIILEKDS